MEASNEVRKAMTIESTASRAGEKTLAEILAPIHEDFRKSGLTEAELDALLEECREEVWQEKQARKG